MRHLLMLIIQLCTPQTTDFQMLHCTIPDITQDSIPFTLELINSIAHSQAESFTKDELN